MFTVVTPTTSLSLDDHFIKRPAATFFVTVEGGGMAEHGILAGALFLAGCMSGDHRVKRMAGAGLGNATAGLLNRDAVATSIERVLLSPEVVRLTRPPRSAEGRGRYGAYQAIFDPSQLADGD